MKKSKVKDALNYLRGEVRAVKRRTQTLYELAVIVEGSLTALEKEVKTLKDMITDQEQTITELSQSLALTDATLDDVVVDLRKNHPFKGNSYVKPPIK
jgi:predicted  nucleic acid-binding Zn-ribbon protein